MTTQAETNDVALDSISEVVHDYTYTESIGSSLLLSTTASCEFVQTFFSLTIENLWVRTQDLENSALLFP